MKAFILIAFYKPGIEMFVQMWKKMQKQCLETHRIFLYVQQHHLMVKKRLSYYDLSSYFTMYVLV